MDPNQDTICAVATPPGTGGISVIRVSGPQSYKICRRLADFLPENPESHRIYYGFLKKFESQEPLDEVLISYFAEGRSFTGEETVEISCHGSPLICAEILDELILAGARAARPGEFTFRAFMNGRVDLVQAESVHALVESRSDLERRNALRQLGGAASAQIQSITKELSRLLAHIEADIDFSEENLAIMDRPEMTKILLDLEARLERLIQSYRGGRALREGFRVLLLGEPNVGKSSLLNLVLGQERAIVTKTPGTTRDLIEGWLEISGIRTSWMDTAGLRETGEEIEALGIRRARDEAEKADLIFWVVDLSGEVQEEEGKFLRTLLSQGRDIILVGNKKDLVPSAVDKARELARVFGIEEALVVSAQDEKDRSALIETVARRVGAFEGANEVMISQARHHRGLLKTLERCREARAVVESGQGLELVAIPLKEALNEAQEILGERYDEQVIDEIFREFCLGK